MNRWILVVLIAMTAPAQTGCTLFGIGAQEATAQWETVTPKELVQRKAQGKDIPEVRIDPVPPRPTAFAKPIDGRYVDATAWGVVLVTRRGTEEIPLERIQRLRVREGHDNDFVLAGVLMDVVIGALVVFSLTVAPEFKGGLW
jgi:hypothetical protein